MPRKKTSKPLPDNLREGCIVKVTSSNLRGPKIGFLIGYCRKADGGLEVYLPDESTITKWHCIQEERGDTIIKIS